MPQNFASMKLRSTLKVGRLKMRTRSLINSALDLLISFSFPSLTVWLCYPCETQFTLTWPSRACLDSKCDRDVWQSPSTFNPDRSAAFRVHVGGVHEDLRQRVHDALPHQDVASVRDEDVRTLPQAGQNARLQAPHAHAHRSAARKELQNNLICHCWIPERFVGRFRNHDRSVAGVKDFRCQYCSAAFSQVGNLKRHQRIHTGQSRRWSGTRARQVSADHPTH